MYKGRRERLSGLPNFVPRAFCLYGGKWSWHHPVTRHPEFSLGCFDMANQIIESSAISQSDYRIVRHQPIRLQNRPLDALDTELLYYSVPPTSSNTYVCKLVLVTANALLNAHAPSSSIILYAKFNVSNGVFIFSNLDK